LPKTTIRQVATEEILEPFFSLTSYAFHPSPPFRDKDEWEAAIRGRKEVQYLALFEDETVVATVAGSAMTQHVRGKLYGASGIWGVVTDPASRRKGYCRRLMARLLAAQRDEGRTLSCLYPFRASFYERLGYATFPLPRKATFAPSALIPLIKQDLGGEVDRVLIGDGYDAYQEYTRRLQQRTHGMGVWVHGEKERLQKENRSWLALAKVEGEVVGLMVYELKGEAVTRFTLRAQRFYYDTSQARYLLLQWIARHVDQASEVTVWLPPFEQPETWLADMRLSSESMVRAPMGRVVDVARLGGMEAGPGRFSARIRDALCPWNEGSSDARAWQFETVEGRLEVSVASEADCELTIQALAALIYGTHDPGDFSFRGWGNPSPAVQATMRSMFPPRVPYLHEYF
jgi:predicted acetyltransferase